MKENLQDKSLNDLEKIGIPEIQKLQPVRNMIVNNLSIELDHKLDQVIRWQPVEDIDFDEYMLAETTLKINEMYNQKLEDFLFLRKQIDAMFVKTKRWFRRLFFLHLVYVLLLVLPIFYPEPTFRIYCSWICLFISVIFTILELISFIHAPKDHYHDWYNIIDSMQIFFQIPYAILVTRYKDVELPYLQNNPESLESYGITHLDQNRFLI